MKQSIILLGGGGHCKSCIDVIESTNQYNIIGILDPKEMIGQKILNYEVIGTDEEIDSLLKKVDCFHISVGQIKTPIVRTKLFDLLIQKCVKIPFIISPNAHVSKYAKIGDGSIIMHGAIINAGAIVGKNCIINSKALIEHDAQIEDFCHISTGAIINGESIVKKNSFIGSGAVVVNSTMVPENSFIMAGSLFIK